MKYQAIFFVLILFAPAIVSAADPIVISTDKQTYHYGDYLSLTIRVSEISANVATMHIIDSAGTKSTAIPIQIQNKTTTITAPNPFDPMLFKEGRYKIEVTYDGVKSFTEFELVDAGNIVMPFGSNIIVPQWLDGFISDYSLLKFLLDEKLVHLPPNKTLDENTKIPSWFRTVGGWWFEKRITDSEFITCLQYLLEKKIVN